MFITDVAAKCYSSGPAVTDALKVSRQFARRGIAATICYWNDSGESADLIWNAYAQIVDGLRGCANRSTEDYLSIKLPALGFNGELLDRLLDRASVRNVSIHFDSLDHAHADRTFSALQGAIGRNPTLGFGCTLPGRWRRSLLDAEVVGRLLLRVRVVKGEWHDPLHPQTDLRVGFLDVIDRLAGGAAVVAVATHDPDLADEAARRLIKSGTSCELEVLYGRPMRRIMTLARTLNLPVRVYIPCGRAWLPYRLKAIHQSPQIAGWFARDLLKGATQSLMRFKPR